MTDPNFSSLHVQNPPASATFCTGLMGKPPVEASPGFALFALQSGSMPGLWAVAGVPPGGEALSLTHRRSLSVAAHGSRVAYSHPALTSSST